MKEKTFLKVQFIVFRLEWLFQRGPFKNFLEAKKNTVISQNTGLTSIQRMQEKGLINVTGVLSQMLGPPRDDNGRTVILCSRGTDDRIFLFDFRPLQEGVIIRVRQWKFS